MDLGRLLIRLAIWARHRPSRQLIMITLAVLAIVVVVVTYERVFGWPEWLTVGPRVRTIPR